MLRKLEGIENRFADPLSSSLIELAIKFEDKNSVKKAISNFEKMFVGLKMKVVDGHFHENSESHFVKMPNWIQDCRMACDWIYENHTYPIHDRLTTIASNDRIVVVNSNHDVSDGGFMIKAIQRCLDDNLKENNFKCTLPESVCFKDEMERAEKAKPYLLPYDQATSYDYDSKDPELDPNGVHQKVIHDQISVENLKCYDAKLKRPKQLTESIWTAITMTMSAMNDNDVPQHLALPIIIDTRKYKDNQNEIDIRYTNCVSAANICAKPTNNTTISEICAEFRNDLKRHEKDAIYYWIKNGNFIGKPDKAYGMSSSIGAIKLKKPVLDFFIQSRAANSNKLVMNPSFGAGLNVFSFSKVTDTKNEFNSTVNYYPVNTTVRKAYILHDVYMHFLTQTPMDTKFGEALSELKNFRKKIQKEY